MCPTDLGEGEIVSGRRDQAVEKAVSRMLWIFVGTWSLTFFAVCLVWLDWWALFSGYLSLAFREVWNWPVGRGACALSAISVLFPYYQWWETGNEQGERFSVFGQYFFALVWVPVFVWAFGAESGSMGSRAEWWITILLVCLAQGIGAELIARQIRQTSTTAEPGRRER